MNTMNEIFKSKRRESERAANIKVSANIHWSKLFTWGGGTALREVCPGSDAAQLEQTSLHTGRKHHPSTPTRSPEASTMLLPQKPDVDPDPPDPELELLFFFSRSPRETLETVKKQQNSSPPKLVSQTYKYKNIGWFWAAHRLWDSKGKLIKSLIKTVTEHWAIFMHPSIRAVFIKQV